MAFSFGKKKDDPFKDQWNLKGLKPWAEKNC